MSLYQTEQVAFKSGGVNIKGLLISPTKSAGKHKAMVVIGPVAFVKEQSPLQYATRLAKMGFATLIFDPRGYGESEGEPRQIESGNAKTQDIQAAADYLETRSDIDADRIHLLAICQGANWGVQAAIADARFKTLSLVAGNYLSRATAEMYCGGPEKADARIARGKVAREKFEAGGAVDYMKIVKEQPDDEAFLPYPAPFPDWYLLWGHRVPFFKYKGLWENRISVMSEESLWGFQVDREFEKLQTPVLMIHSDNAATGAQLPRQFFASIPAKTKKLVWLQDQSQLQFYDDALTIDKATEAMEMVLASPEFSG